MQFFDTKECEWSDVKLHFAGASPVKLLGFSFKATKEKEAIYGAGDRPIGIQSGNRSFTGELKFHKGVLDDLNAASRIAGGADVLDAAADVIVTFKAKGSRQLQTIVAVNVEITEYDYNMQQGAKSMEVTLPIVFLDLKIS